jgi:hypothetical protein
MLHDTTAIWGDRTYDSFLYQAARGHIVDRQPRVVLVGSGEKDEGTHDERYDQ